MYPPFQQTFVYIFNNKLKEPWQLNFVHKMYTKVCRNTLDIFYIHFVYINSDLQKVYIDHKKNHTEYYTNNCMENRSHISTYFDLFVA